MQEGLVFQDIVKSFGGTQALRGVSLEVARGEILALLGENGAGKSTLIKILGGIHRADGGAVMIGGEPYQHAPGRLDRRQAVAFIHQDLGLIEWMTVAENIALALGYRRRRGLIAWDHLEETARLALAKVDCNFDPSLRVSSLTRTEKSLVAIARALAVECDYLVLDEPTASLPADEVGRLFAALKPLRESGVGMIYVSHRLDEVFRIADRVAVLRDGLLVGTRNVAQSSPAELVDLIVGRETRKVQRPTAGEGRSLLNLKGFRTERVGPLDLELHQGEIVGLVGLRGAGHEDVGRALFGLRQHEGRVTLDDKTLTIGNPRAAMRAGIGLVAGDRVVESIAPVLTIRENAFINPLASGRRLLTLMSAAREAMEAAVLGRTVGLSPNDPGLAIEALSGGNQQKVVVGRWLPTARRLLIAEDPTAGVDVGAKAEIYGLLYDALGSGMAVLVISTDFEEVAQVCHRALVFSRGQVEAELAGSGLTTSALIQAASASEGDGIGQTDGAAAGMGDHAIH